MKRRYFCACFLACLATAGLAPAEGSRPKGLDELERLFRETPMEARRGTGPLYWMHGDESPAQLRGELARVLEGGNGNFTAEPRPHADWLGEGWYRDLGLGLDFARSNDLQMIIFDDWWWPSQMMGGRVPAPYGSKRLQASAVTVAGPRAFSAAGYDDANLIAVIAGRAAAGDAVEGGSLVDLTASVRDGTLSWPAPAGTWRVMKFSWSFVGKGGGQQKYISVDGASPDCVDWFLRAVYQPHFDRFKDDFGKTITGFFYDEPETQGDWGSDVPKVIAERGLDLKKLLVAYKFKLAGEEQTAALYGFLDSFAEAWGRTMYGGMSRWCREHGVYSMGHFMEHHGDFYSRTLSGGNVMQLQKYSDMGGIDLVCHQLYPGGRNEGLYQMPKLASSISHTYNKADDIAFSEIYGGYDQKLTYPVMKWLADWHQVRGVNFLIPHSFNPRAPFDRDYPPYFYNGGREPRWPLYRVWADYNNRLNVLLTGGRHVAPVAFLNLGQSIHVGRSRRPEGLTSALQDALFDCDWLLYDAWENDAELAGREIRLHKETYRVLCLPAVEAIPYPTLRKAKEFFERGGVVIGYDMLPSRSATLGRGAADIAALRETIWGAPTAGLACCKTSAAGGRSYFLPAEPAPEDIQKVLAADAGIHPTLEVLAGDTGHWLHVLHRQKSGRDVFLVCNQNHEGAARSFTFRIAAAGEPECWDAMRNEITAVPCRRLDARTVEVDLTLEPSESALLVFHPRNRDLPLRLDGRSRPVIPPIPVTRDPVVAATAPAAADAARDPLEGCPWVWYPEGNPAADAPVGTRFFRGAVTVPATSKITAARFVLSADNEFALFVNGRRLAARVGDGEAWRKPETVDIAGALVAGENHFAILGGNLGGVALSPAGLIGRYTIEFESGPALVACIDGSWKSWDQEQAGWFASGFDDRDWRAANVVAAYGAGPWGRLDGRARPYTASPVQADPFHGRVALPADVDLKRARVCLEMDDLTPETAARVTVNGRDAGGFIGRPLRLDITAHVKPGANEIRLEPFAPPAARLVVYDRTAAAR